MRGLATMVMVAGLGLPSLAWASGPTLQDRQQAACYEDVMRFCSEVLPDIDRVTACMQTKRELVSAPCAAFYPKGKR